jgi:putative addiction module CopG family antidote
MHVTLTPELERLIDSEVQAGRFQNADEFLRAAVHHFVAARDLGESYALEELEGKIARGLAQVEQGETIDGDEAFLRLRSLSAERRLRLA